MDLAALCDRCGRPAVPAYGCGSCGKKVCENCFDFVKMVCKTCASANN